MNKIIQFFKKKEVETWAWEALNSFILLLIVFLEANINPEYALLAGMVIASLNQVTKYINLRFIKK